MTTSRLPEGKLARKNIPLARGLLDYFPSALAGVAELSRVGNEQHNPGEELHWDRNKSNDHADCILRHLIDRDKVDEDGIPHVFKVAWRALALAQEYCEKSFDAEPGLASRFGEAPVDEATPPRDRWGEGLTE